MVQVSYSKFYIDVDSAEITLPQWREEYTSLITKLVTALEIKYHDVNFLSDLKTWLSIY